MDDNDVEDVPKVPTSELAASKISDGNSEKSKTEETNAADDVDAKKTSTVLPPSSTTRPGGDAPDTNLLRRELPPTNPSSSAQTSEHCYNMNHKHRGLAIIISNRVFHPATSMTERTGTEVDMGTLCRQFRVLGFDVKVYQNISSKEMEFSMRSAAKDEIHNKSDAFACAILSHGEEGKVYGTDGTIEIDKLVAPFKGDVCKALAGKPKLFFIQACRGQQLDHGTEVTDAGEDDVDAHVLSRIPAEADFLMAYSVVPGYFSWRNSVRGSWFIQALCAVLEEYGSSLDLLKIMTRVNRKVAYEFESNAAREFMNRKKQIPSIVSMLTKDLYFTPKS